MEIRKAVNIINNYYHVWKSVKFLCHNKYQKKKIWHWGRSCYFTFYTNDASSKPGNMHIYITLEKRGASPTIILHWPPHTTIGINWLVLKTLPTDLKEALLATTEIITIMRTRFNKKKNQNRNFFIYLIKHWTGVFLFKRGDCLIWRRI